MSTLSTGASTRNNIDVQRLIIKNLLRNSLKSGIGNAIGFV